VKLIKADQGKFSFQLARRERDMLLHVLSLYPLVPVAHQQLSKTGHRPEDQQLLEESLAAQRKKNRQRIQILLRAKSRFEENAHGFRLLLTSAQMDWLLQALNDVRVGSWLILGSPDGPEETFAFLSEKTAPYFWAMEVAGDFQMALVKAMSGG
jgi:hypothetical protein